MPASSSTEAHSSGRSRLLGRVALSAVVILLITVATGCLTGDVSVKINKGGSGTIDIELLPYDELQKMLVDTGAVSMAEKAVDEFDDASFESTTVDGRIAYRAHIPFDDYQDLVDAMTNGVQIAGLNLRVFSEFTLTEVDDQWRLDGTIAPELLADALRSDPSIQQLLDSEGLTALNSDLRLTVALPGKIVRTNGDRLASGTARWSLKKDQQPHITMMTEPKPLLTFVQKIFLGAILAIVLGVMFNLWGSRTSWQSGRSERKERRRAKKLTFGPKRAGDGPGRWDNSGPIAPAVEGTVPDSGPMPPRAIPTLRDSTVAAANTQIVTPPISNLAPVAAPVAPAVDPNIPDPFAPHRPGQTTGQGVGVAAAHESVVAPIAPPVAPPVDPNVPNPFAPHVPGAPMAGQVPAPAPPAPAPAPVATNPAPAAAVPAPAPPAQAPDMPPAGGPAAQPEPLRFDLDDEPDMETMAVRFDLVDDDDVSSDLTGAVMFDLVEEQADLEPAVQTPTVAPTMDSAEGTSGQYADASYDAPPAPVSEPEPFDDPGFNFDGTPGWFSAEAGGVDDGLAEDPTVVHGAPEPASIPEPESAAEPTFSPDPGFTAETDAGHEIPAAWYPDPDDPSRYRWWDGLDWTDYVSGGGS